MSRGRSSLDTLATWSTLTSRRSAESQTAADGGSTARTVRKPAPSRELRSAAPEPATSTSIQRSTATHAWPTPRRCRTSRPRRPSRSWRERENGSQLMASRTSSGSRPTTDPVTAPQRSPTHWVGRGTNGSRPTRPGTTERSSATTGSSPKSSYTRGPGPQKTNASRPSNRGTCTTTTPPARCRGWSAAGHSRASSRQQRPGSYS